MTYTFFKNDDQRYADFNDSLYRRISRQTNDENYQLLCEIIESYVYNKMKTDSENGEFCSHIPFEDFEDELESIFDEDEDTMLFVSLLYENEDDIIDKLKSGLSKRGFDVDYDANELFIYWKCTPSKCNDTYSHDE